MNKVKNLIAWLLLLVLIICTLFISYIKYFSIDIKNSNIEERTVNESSSIAIHKALNDITINFNNNVKEYSEKNNININAIVNNYSIFISYIDATTTTYEFNYEDLYLNIVVNNDEENLKKFNIIYKYLIKAVQDRINNQSDIDEVIEDFLIADINYDGLIKSKSNGTIKYQMNITKKLEKGGLDDGDTTHRE